MRLVLPHEMPCNTTFPSLGPHRVLKFQGEMLTFVAPDGVNTTRARRWSVCLWLVVEAWSKGPNRVLKLQGEMLTFVAPDGVNTARARRWSVCLWLVVEAWSKGTSGK